MSATLTSAPRPAVNFKVGNERLIRVLPGASGKLTSLLRKQGRKEHGALRVAVVGGGCSGLQYGMVFDESRGGDVTAEFFDTKVLVDEFSTAYLKGAVIDFSDALTGGGFKISNPAARHSCGCGKSFEA